MSGRIVGAKVCRRVGARLRAGALPQDALRSRARARTRARVRTDRAHEVPEVIEDGGVLGRGGGQDQADHRPLAGIGDVQLVGPRPAPTGGSPKERARPPALASGQRSGDHGGRRVGPVSTGFPRFGRRVGARSGNSDRSGRPAPRPLHRRRVGRRPVRSAEGNHSGLAPECPDLPGSGLAPTPRRRQTPCRARLTGGAVLEVAHSASTSLLLSSFAAPGGSCPATLSLSRHGWRRDHECQSARPPRREPRGLVN